MQKKFKFLYIYILNSNTNIVHLNVFRVLLESIPAMLPCYVCTKEGQKGSNLDKLGELVSSEPWPNGYPLCKDSLWFIFKYRVEKRIRIVALFFFVVSDCLFLACCRVLPASSFPSWTVQTFQLSTLGDDILCWGYSPHDASEVNQLFVHFGWGSLYLYRHFMGPRIHPRHQSFAKLLPILSIYAVDI